MELEILKKVALYIKEHAENSNCSYSTENFMMIQSIIIEGICQVQKCCQSCKCTKHCQSCTESKCVQQSLQLLGQLANYITQKDILQSNSSVQTNILSIAHSQYMSVFLHFIVKIGLSRNFDIQLPVSSSLKGSKTQCYIFDLYEISISLLAVLDCEEIKTILLPKYLLEILGALIQISYSTLSRKILQKSQRHKCLSLLTDIITKHSHLTDVTRCLLTLQGSNTRQNPTWLTNACGNLLSKCLLQPNGVASIISAMTASFDGFESDWKKSELISNILSTPPLTSRSSENYFQIICPQLIQLLQTDINKDAQQFLYQTASATILEINHKHSQMAAKYIFDQLLSPLQHDTVLQPNGREDITIEKFIEILHVIFATFKHRYREEAIVKHLLPYFYILFRIYKDIKNSINFVVSHIDDLIYKCLQTQNSTQAAKLILSACGSLQLKDKGLFILKPHLKATFNESGDLTLRRILFQNSLEELLVDQDNKVEAFNKFIQNKKEFLPAIFLMLIRNLSDIGENVDKNSQNLLSTEDKTFSHLLKNQPRLITFALIVNLCESNEPSDLVDDVIQICKFVKTIFVRSIDPANVPDVETTNLEGLKTCLAIVGLCLLNDLTTEEHTALKSLLPILLQISELPSLSQREKETTSDLMIAIATRSSGFQEKSFSDSLKTQSEYLNKMKQHNVNKKSSEKKLKGRNILIEEITNDFSNKTGLSTSRTNEQNSSKINYVPSQKDSKSESLSLKIQVTPQSINEHLDAVYDSNPAIRASAFRFLSKASKQKSKCPNERVGSLFQVFIDQLEKETESYVYLSIVQCLVDLVNFSPLIAKENSNSKSSLSRLLTVYISLLLSPNKDEQMEVKCLKLGEVVMRIITYMGDLAPYYGRKLVPNLFAGMKDYKPLIRASCFSNMSEIFPLLLHDISSNEQELCACICGAISTDEDLTVRRSAVHLIGTIIEKLGCNILQALPNTMKLYYRTLKEVYTKDKDNVIQLHSQLALESLDKIMREAIFAKNRFEKNEIVLPLS